MAEISKNEPAPVVKNNGGTPAPVASPFNALRREIDRLFDGFSVWRPFERNVFDLLAPSADGTTAMITPAVEATEKPDAYEITVELPGLDEKDVHVDVADGTLTIKGEKRAESERKDKDYHMSERSYGSFVRSFRVPSNVDSEKIAAAFAKGVLSVRLPKAPKPQPSVQKIEVKPAA